MTFSRFSASVLFAVFCILALIRTDAFGQTVSYDDCPEVHYIEVTDSGLDSLEVVRRVVDSFNGIEAGRYIGPEQGFKTFERFARAHCAAERNGHHPVTYAWPSLDGVKVRQYDDAAEE